MPPRIYLDHNATTPIHPQVEKNLRKYWVQYGNPSSMHSEGRAARTAIDEARERIAALLKIPRHTIVFTGSGSEANNQIINSVTTRHLIQKQPAHIITSCIEHACIRNALKQAAQLGVTVTELPVNQDGIVSPEEVRTAIRIDTQLITIMHANNEIGSIQPIQEIAEIATTHKIPMHTDAVQSLGKMPLNIPHLGVDFATVSAHKIGGPKGIAALIVRNEEWLSPFIFGGPQERMLRAGTEATPLIMAFADAVEIAYATLTDTQQRYIQLKTEFLNWAAAFPEIMMISTENGLPNTISLAVQGINGDTMVRNMDLNGIAISTGSACSTGAVDPSHVISALGHPEWVTTGAFRVSMGASTTSEIIQNFQDILSKIIGKNPKR